MTFQPLLHDLIGLTWQTMTVTASDEAIKEIAGTSTGKDGRSTRERAIDGCSRS